MRAAQSARTGSRRARAWWIVDSLRGAVTSIAADTVTPASVYWGYARRLFAALDVAVRR